METTETTGKTITNKPTTNEDIFKSILNELYSIYKKKNNDYGSSFDKTFDEFGITAPLVRLSDKMNRLVSLTKNNQMVNDESVQDTLMDLANYAILTVMKLKTTNKD